MLLGIATEDGCFMSGLNRRFEIGHLYPSDDVSRVTEMSPICISTETYDDESYTLNGSSHESRLISTKRDSGSDSSRDEGSLNKRTNCECIFQLNRDKSNESDTENGRFVHRGLFGPGYWHCYTAIVDGLSSQIRIDGVSEPMTHKMECYQEEEPKKGQAMLDGLTIGSDHCFGMSLCCGNGSGGEGEGAISELVVFSGVLEEQDICTIELYLMSKHGIRSYPSSELSSKSSNQTRKENSWAKQAHALLVAHDFSDAYLDEGISSERIPLRFLARHRSVAWQYNDAVTGKLIRTAKIGCRYNPDSSSEW
jgi:hypothetical protein